MNRKRFERVFAAFYAHRNLALAGIFAFMGLFFFMTMGAHKAYAVDERPLNALIGTGFTGGWAQDWNGGYSFNPTASGTISALWARGDSGATQTVRLWNQDTSTLLATATMTGSGTTTWVSCTLTAACASSVGSISVTAGTNYIVTQQSQSGYYLPYYSPRPAAQTIGSITYNYSVVVSNPTSMPTDHTTYSSYQPGLPDITFTAGGGGGGGAEELPDHDFVGANSVNNAGYNYQMGYKFTANANGYIDKLWYIGAGSGTVTMRLYSGSNTTPDVTTTVTAAGTGNWVSTPISNYTVTSGNNYRVTAYNPSSGNSYVNTSSYPFTNSTGHVTINCTVYNGSGGDSYPEQCYTGSLYGIADISYHTGAAGATTTIATDSDPVTFPVTTIGPGSSYVAGAFSLAASSGTDSVTAATVTLANSGSPYLGVSQVDITSANGATTYCTTSSISSNVVAIASCSTPIPVTTSTTTFMIKVYSKSHANMPAVPGATYSPAPYISAFTSTNTHAGTDDNSATFNIDNASPNSATSTSGSAGSGAVTLNWTTSSSTDYGTSVVLRWASSSAGSDVPVEGTTYTAGNTIGTATVACVISSAGVSTAVSKIDGTSGSTGCNTSALTGGQAYSYKVFQMDTRFNYDAGVSTSMTNLTPTSAGPVTFNPTGSGSSGSTQTWVVPSTGTYTIEGYGASAGSTTGGSGNYPGRGAYIKGNFSLTAGQTLKILVGQQGGNGFQSSGGGGGTFVVDNSNNNPFLVAGGGGGSRDGIDSRVSTADASTSTSGVTSGGAGGSGGSGGSVGFNGGGGGGGLTGNGATGYSSTGGGLSLTNGGTGGAVTCGSTNTGAGGYGGGAAGEWCYQGSGGGGGGYSGGGGGSSPSAGGGGGSYNGGTSQTNTASLSTGAGQVIITSLGVINTTTLATGTDPSTATIAPGASVTDSDAFTLATSAGTDSVTAMQIRLTNSLATPYLGVSQVTITSDNGATQYFNAVTSVNTGGTNTLNFSGGTPIPVSTSATQFKIRITPLSHANMPAVPGASYVLIPNVQSFTSTNTQAGSDTNSGSLTIDNLSPNGATSTSATAGNGTVTMAYTSSSSSDVAQAVTLRWAAGSAGSEVPVEGTSYSTGTTIGTATVACILSVSASSAYSNIIDGTFGAGCTSSSLTNGQAYTYKIFQKDSNGNYDAGVTIGTFTPAAPTSTLGTGSDPSSTTTFPGAGVTDAGVFTLQTNSGTDTVTGLTVTLAGTSAPNAGVSNIIITANDNSVYGTFNSINLSGSTTFAFTGLSIPVTTSLTTFKIRITPLSATSMPAVPGASYSVNPFISAWTSTNAHAGSDSNSQSLTIDNTSPNSATSTSGTAGTNKVTLNWTTSSSSDYSGTLILRWAASSPGSDVPVEGNGSYGVGSTIGSATVACLVFSNGSSVAKTKVDGAGGSTGECNTSNLTAGQAYSYKIFQYDTSLNYDAGVTVSGGPFTPPVPYQTTSTQSGFFNIGTTWGGTCSSSCTAGVDYPSTSQSVTIANGHTVTLQASQTVASATVNGGGTLALGANTLTLSGSGNALSIGGTFTPNTGTIQYTGSGVNVAATTYYNLQLGSGGIATYTLAGNTTVNNVTTVTTNATLALSSFTLVAAGTSPFTVNGSISMGTGTIDYSGTNAAIANLTYYNLKVSGSNTSAVTAIVTNNLNVTGTLNQTSGTITLNGGSSYTSASSSATFFNLATSCSSTTVQFNNGFTIASSLVNGSSCIFAAVAGAVTLNHNITLTNNGTMTFYDLTLASGGANVNTNATYFVSHSIIIPTGGSLNQTAGTVIFNPGSSISNTAGTLSFQDMTVYTSASVTGSANFTVKGLFLNSPGGSFTATSGTQTFANGSTINNGGNTVQFFNMTVPAGATISANTNYTVAGTLSVSSTGSLAPTSGTITLSGTGTPLSTVTADAWCSISSSACNSSWLTRKKITFNNTASSSNLTNFPILVTLTSSNIDYSKTKSGGADIRFVDADGVTSLPYQIETWNASGTSTVWVKVPQIDSGSATDYIYMYYNNTAATDAQSAASVWDSNYKGIYHLPDGTTLSATDSTGTSNGTLVNSPAAVTGQMGGAASFVAGSSQYINTNNTSIAATDSLTFSAWVKFSVTGAETILNRGEDNSGNGWSASLFKDASEHAGFQVVTTSAGATAFTATGTTVMALGTWYHLTGVWTAGSSVKIYLNGNLEQTTNTTTTSLRTSTKGLEMARALDGTITFTAVIDEARFSNSARTADWVKAEYLAENGSMSTFGGEETYSIPTNPFNPSGTSIVQYTGATATVTATPFANLTLGNGGTATYTLPAGAVTLTGNLVVSNNATVTKNASGSIVMSSGLNQTITDNNATKQDLGNIQISSGNAGADGTGGVITHSGGYTIHTFTSSGTFNPGNNTSVEYLVVGGGGGGGQTIGGGGGAGGVLTGTGYSVSNQSYTVTVGAGGAGDPANSGTYATSGGTAGGNSAFGATLIAIGGGAGGAYNQSGDGSSTGGSGGGKGACSVSAVARTGTTGQGNAGGTTGSCNGNDGAGGGGAATVGGTAVSGTAGAGGAGIFSSISGAGAYYAGGGGGAARNPAGIAGGAGGAGGGGAGGFGNTAGTAGTANTGGGGGGGGYADSGGISAAGGAGGSGVVIIRYLTPTTTTAAVDSWCNISSTVCNASWLNRKKITFNNTASTTNLTNFPVLVTLTTANFDYTKTKAAGADLRFVDSDGVTGLSYQIETWNSSGTSTVWVRVPTLDKTGTDYIYMYYNNTAATDNQVGSGSVWDSNFKLVYHMGDGSTLSAIDATSVGNNGTVTGATATSGQINGAGTFAGSSSTSIASNSNLGITGTASRTLSAWYYNTVGTSGSVLNHGALETANQGFEELCGPGVSAHWYGGGNSFSGGTNTVSTWNQCVVTYDGTTVKAYLNGALVGSQAATLATADSVLRVAGQPLYSGSSRFTGKVDEVRASNTARSADWIRAEYLTDNNAMNTFGAEEGAAVTQIDPWCATSNCDATWLSRQKITFNNANSTTNLVNFPVAITLNASNIDYTKTQNNGQDIRFVDSDGITALPYQIETWDETGNSVAWVKVPQINNTNTDYIYIYYNNIAAADAQSATSVWDSNFGGVFHMPDYGNSTGNNGSSAAGGVSTLSSGKIGSANNFNGSGGINLTAISSYNVGTGNGMTADAWVYLPTLAVNQPIIEWGNTANFGVHLWHYPTSGKIYVNVVDTSAGTHNFQTTGTPLVAGSWQHVGFTYNKSTGAVAIYYNGVAQALDTSNIGTITPQTTYNLNIGQRPLSAGPFSFTGYEDEVRVSNIARSADWMKAEYLNGNGSFTTFLGQQVSGSLGVSLGSSVKATTLQIDAGKTFSLGGANTLTLTANGSNVLVNNGTFNASTGTVEFKSASTTGTTVPVLPYYNLQLNSAGNTFTPAGNLTVNNFNLTAGTFTAPSVLTVNGSFINTGTFNANNGNVSIVPTSTTLISQILGNSTTFFNLTDTVPGSTLQFNSGSTYSFTGLLTISPAGGSNKPIWVTSQTQGQQFTVTFSATPSLSFINVRDAICSGGVQVNQNRTIYNQGNNTGSCWGFIIYNGVTGSSGGGGGSGSSSGGGGGAGGGGAPVQATATATQTSGSINNSVVMTNVGSGYTTAPSICFAGSGGGSGATAIATLSSGTVSAITVTSGGSNYSGTITVGIAAPPGTGGSACSSGGGGGAGGGGGGSP